MAPGPRAIARKSPPKGVQDHLEDLALISCPSCLRFFTLFGRFCDPLGSISGFFFDARLMMLAPSWRQLRGPKLIVEVQNVIPNLDWDHLPSDGYGAVAGSARMRIWIMRHGI